MLIVFRGDVGVAQFSVGGDGTIVKLEDLNPLSLTTTPHHTTPHYHCNGLYKCHSQCIPYSWFIKTTSWPPHQLDTCTLVNDERQVDVML